MPDPIEQLVEVEFPLGGMDVSVPYDEQPTVPMADRPPIATTPLAVNVQSYEPQTYRGRGGSRPGISEYVPETVMGAATLIQNLNYVIDPRSISAQNPGDNVQDNNVIINMPLPPGNNQGNGTTLPGDVDSNAPSTTADPRDGRLVRTGGSHLARSYKRYPIIMWPTPAPITQGTALSGTQLDATANTAGSFDYEPPAGTVLPSGSQRLSVYFTPNDNAHWWPANAVQRIQVTSSITFVQAVADNPFPSPCTKNNILIAVCKTQANGGVAPVTNVTDTIGNTYTKIATAATSFFQTSGANYYGIEIWYAINKANGSNTVTVTSPASFLAGGNFLEYSGVASTPQDHWAINHVNDDGSTPLPTATAGPVAVGASGEMLLACLISDLPGGGYSWTTPAGYTLRVGGGAHAPSGPVDNVWDKMGVGVGAYNVSISSAGPGASFGYAIVFLSIKHG